MSEKETVYISNIQILYSDLKNAINDYIEGGYSKGESKFINAYLMAVIGAIVAYKDTIIKGQESEEIKACKYANNMLKHDPIIVTHIKPTGGIEFPIEIPLEIPEIDVVWKWQDLDAHHQDQKDAFKKLFVGKPVLETLEGVLSQIGIVAE